MQMDQRIVYPPGVVVVRYL